jgi:amidophosphoribosyltransferase
MRVNLESIPNHSIELEKPGDACGVVGIYDPEATGKELVSLMYRGIFALQGRGQTGAGAAVFDGMSMHIEKDSGLVTEALPNERLRTLETQSKSPTIIGHVLYSTSGETDKKRNARLAHPFGAMSNTFALAHNGNIDMDMVRSVAHRMSYDIDDCVSDTESITFMLDELLQEHGDLLDAMHILLPQLEGAYSMVINEPDRLIGVRDPRGYRPLSIGQLPSGGMVLASESIAFDTMGAQFVRDVEPGEIVTIDKEGLHSERLWPKPDETLCLFEHFYLAHEGSILRGKSVFKVREQLGKFMAIDHPVDADVIVGIQNSGDIYAQAYAEQLGIPKKPGVVNNKYINRTFILDSQLSRQEAVQLKHQPSRVILEGQRVVLVDDSVIRGTTMRELVKMVYGAGAKEVHVRIPSPMYISPCYYGMDTKRPDELISRNKTLEETREYFGCDSLAFISIDRALEAVNTVEPVRGYGYDEAVLRLSKFCLSCMTGEYPTAVPVTINTKAKELVTTSKNI